MPQYAHLRMRGQAVVANTGRASASRHVAMANSPSLRRDMSAVMEAYVSP